MCGSKARFLTRKHQHPTSQKLTSKIARGAAQLCVQQMM